MELIKNIILLVVGFVQLVKGADFFVDGSSAVAKKLKIPSIIIGLTIVAMGTSLPELAVSLSAAIEGANEIAVSNVIGSNLFNLMVVLGICAIISPIAVEKSVMKREMPFMLVITAILAGFIIPWNGMSASVNIAGRISRADGIILLILFAIFMIITVKTALKSRKSAIEAENSENQKEISLPVSLVYIVVGICAIKYGGDFVVDGASFVATKLGMSQTLVGLTIVAVGTSLPELVTSIVAARKGETALAVGNVVGSNIFNILLILGVSAAISPINVTLEALIDVAVVLVTGILVFLFGRSKEKISRAEGIIMVLIYVIYMVYAIIR